jgi:hypothetical protein
MLQLLHGVNTPQYFHANKINIVKNEKHLPKEEKCDRRFMARIYNVIPNYCGGFYGL